MGACKHEYRSCDVTNYVRCACGTYKSIAWVNPAHLYADSYWIGEHSSLYEQCWNVDMHTENGISKNAFMLSKIGCQRRRALEIGCAPGRMLFWLKWAARFETIVGIDPCNQEEDIRRIGCFGGSLYTELFPKKIWRVGDENFDLVLAMDVFEHSPCPERFLDEAFRIMAPGGQLLLMLPLADELPADSRFFNAREHVYLHATANLRAMLEDAGFQQVEFSRWAIGHDTVSARKP